MNSPAGKDKFICLIEENKAILYKVANSYCRNNEDRKDLVQEVILQLWRSFEKYDEQYKISTWMYRIALNVAISYYRKQKSRKESDTPMIESMVFIADEPAGEDLESNLSLLRQFIAELKELDKALMILYLEENSYKEIAEILGITETNVASKINRIKEKLKQKFKNINQ